MSYLIWEDELRSKYKLCILVNKINKKEIEKEYLTPLGINLDQVIVMDLHQAPGKKKTPAAEMKEYFTQEIVPVLTELEVEYLLVADAEYFKVLTKSAKAEAYLGYMLPNAFGPWVTGYLPNYASVFYNPEAVRIKITQTLEALRHHVEGTYVPPGAAIIKYAAYPETVAEIFEWLDKLHQYPMLSSDIEGFSLKHPDCGIGSITFCWNQEEGIAFAVDLRENTGEALMIRMALRDFFVNYKGTVLWHNISFDVYVLIYQLFMRDLLDTEGLLLGLEVMLKNWHDTKLISYLATNSCAGNKLSLKDQAQEYAGNYAVEEITNIRAIPLKALLQYNLVDGLSTWYVFNKHYPTLLADNQEDIYNNIFKPAIVDIIQMQLTGLPVNMSRVKEVKVLLQADNDAAVDKMRQSHWTSILENILNDEWVIWKNSILKVKRVTRDDAKEVFNPNSNPQLVRLLYDIMALPVIANTKSGAPATDGDTLKALLNHTDDETIIEFLTALRDYKAVDKILTSFIPAMEAAYKAPDGWHYLYGNFNLGGTVSGRLSSSKPNLQNIPATGSRYAKLIKSCFSAPPGWLFAGIDFNSLEDRISALTTKDPNKLKVYTDGYDGHSLRAFSYFGDQMPDIVAKMQELSQPGRIFKVMVGDDPEFVHESNPMVKPGTNYPFEEYSAVQAMVETINSIAKKYEKLRQQSKAPTFALTYQGTFRTLMVNCGFTEEVARMIEEKYHELYVVSDAWVAQKLDQASIDGYATVAFGLRIRTPLLHQVIRGTKRTPREADAEGRTVGNAFGQSYCLLNTRAGIEFMSVVRASPYRLNIRPCAHIHDAQYVLLKNDIETIMFANEHLVRAVEWQNLPEIMHPDVKLGGEFGIFFPSWEWEMGIPNNATEEQIYAAQAKHLAKLAEKNVHFS